MATCDKCGYVYISKECPTCNPTKNSSNNNSNNKTKKIEININGTSWFNQKEKKILKIMLFIFLGMILLFGIIDFIMTIFIMNATSNAIHTTNKTFEKMNKDLKKMDNVFDKNKRWKIGIDKK